MVPPIEARALDLYRPSDFTPLLCHFLLSCG